MRSLGGGGAKRKIYAALTSGVADFSSSSVGRARAQESCKCKLDVDQDTAFLLPFRLAFPFPGRPTDVAKSKGARVHIPSTLRNYKPRATRLPLPSPKLPKEQLRHGELPSLGARSPKFPAFE